MLAALEQHVLCGASRPSVCLARRGFLRRHGDEVERLPGGYYHALGRCDDTMNLGGIKVGSGEACLWRGEKHNGASSGLPRRADRPTAAALLLLQQHGLTCRLVCSLFDHPTRTWFSRPSPHAVELERACIEGVEGVVEAAAVGCPTPGGGPEQLHLFLVLRPGLAAPPLAELQRRCQQAVSSKLNPLFKASCCADGLAGGWEAGDCVPGHTRTFATQPWLLSLQNRLLSLSCMLLPAGAACSAAQLPAPHGEQQSDAAGAAGRTDAQPEQALGKAVLCAFCTVNVSPCILHLTAVLYNSRRNPGFGIGSFYRVLTVKSRARSAGDS